MPSTPEHTTITLSGSTIGALFLPSLDFESGFSESDSSKSNFVLHVGQ
jgi:hypothetical protein